MATVQGSHCDRWPRQQPCAPQRLRVFCVLDGVLRPEEQPSLRPVFLTDSITAFWHTGAQPWHRKEGEAILLPSHFHPKLAIIAAHSLHELSALLQGIHICL